MHYLYATHRQIVARCTSPTHKQYADYGGRGINIYPKWRYDQYSFIRYMLNTLGDRPPGFSLDRIDNNKGYIPGNLRWADKNMQNNNRRNKREVLYKGEVMSQSECAKKVGVSREYIRQMSNGKAKNKYALTFLS